MTITDQSAAPLGSILEIRFACFCSWNPSFDWRPSIERFVLQTSAIGTPNNNNHNKPSAMLKFTLVEVHKQTCTSTFLMLPSSSTSSSTASTITQIFLIYSLRSTINYQPSTISDYQIYFTSKQQTNNCWAPNFDAFPMLNLINWMRFITIISCYSAAIQHCATHSDGYTFDPSFDGRHTQSSATFSHLTFKWTINSTHLFLFTSPRFWIVNHLFLAKCKVEKL